MVSAVAQFVVGLFALVNDGCFEVDLIPHSQLEVIQRFLRRPDPVSFPITKLTDILLVRLGVHELLGDQHLDFGQFGNDSSFIASDDCPSADFALER